MDNKEDSNVDSDVLVRFECRMPRSRVILIDKAAKLDARSRNQFINFYCHEKALHILEQHNDGDL